MRDNPARVSRPRWTPGRPRGVEARGGVATVSVAAAAASAVVNGIVALRLPLWWDEVASARAFTAPGLAGMLAQVRRTEATPPGWYLLCWVLHRAGVALTGHGSLLASERGLRILSIGCSAATAALVVVYAARMLPLWAAGLAGCFAALGDQFLEHGSELRAYALLTLACVVFALAFDAASRHPDRWRLFGLAGSTLVGASTHYFFLTVVAAGAAWVWTSE